MVYKRVVIETGIPPYNSRGFRVWESRVNNVIVFYRSILYWIWKLFFTFVVYEIDLSMDMYLFADLAIFVQPLFSLYTNSFVTKTSTKKELSHFGAVVKKLKLRSFCLLYYRITNYAIRFVNLVRTFNILFIYTVRYFAKRSKKLFNVSKSSSSRVLFKN